MPLGHGEVFAGYTIVRLLGSGGMGEVYLAQHPRLPRKDALKVLAADVSANADYRSRFSREADLASELYHPHIVGVHDRGDDEGQLWISMDYVDGFDTARLLADRYRNGMPADQVTKIVAAVASALDYAHDRGLLHRDVKPANIMMTNDTGEQRILLADFGIARSLNAISSLTATGYTMGTVTYAAPEQLMGLEIDGRTDQYALAATAYHLLTGSQLFPHSLAEKPVSDAAIESVLSSALAKTPNERFPRCTDFARALESAQIDIQAGAAAGPLGRDATQRRARAKSPNATRPRTFETSTPSQDDSVYIPYGDRDAGGRKGRWLSMIGIATVLLLVAVAFFVRPWQQDRSASTTTSTPTSSAPAITFEGMRDFVTGYYNDLPPDPMKAWAKLDPHCQNQTGLRDYLDFWATIQLVTIISVSPRDATSVVARLKYVRQDGQISIEDRWFKMALVNGAIMLDESDRSNPASTTGTSTATRSPASPSVAPTNPYAPLAGKWTGHHRGLTVSADGTIDMDIPDPPACPECSGASMPSATIHIGLTSYDGKPDGTPNGSGKYYGYVKDSSDARVVPTAVPVEVDVTDASDYSFPGSSPDRTASGRVLTVSINNGQVGLSTYGYRLGDYSPFCDEAAAHKSVCGA